MKKIPLRLRLTALSVGLLTLCCVWLTVILNFSAIKMADVIQATPVMPSMEMGESYSQTMTPATTTQAQQAKNNFTGKSIFYMVLVIVAGGGLTFYMTGKALSPLQELSSQMKNRTVHNLSEKLPIPQSNDEIAALTISFNEMSHKLDEAFAMQKRFSQSAAHELRTPLTVLKTKVDVFKKKNNHTKEEYDGLLTVITNQTDRLSTLVQDLLGLSNMEDLNFQEQIEPKALFDEVIKELESLALQKQVNVTITGQENAILGNKSLLQRAFYNLVENAIKYNKENGQVNIALAKENNLAVITVDDTGVGIPKASLNLIFEPFYRVDKSRSRQMGGAGLGLATVKTIIEKHGGTISAISNENEGSSFIVKL